METCWADHELRDKAPKQDIKFDTQGITDSQLKNIIETAEILEAHQGITQEFETDFVQNNTGNELHNLISEKNSATNSKQYIIKDVLYSHSDGHKCSIVNNNENMEINNSIGAKSNDNSETNLNSCSQNIVNDEIEKNNKDLGLNCTKNTEDMEIQASQILTCKTIKRNKKNIVSDFKQIKYDVNRNDVLKYSMVNNDILDITTERIYSNSDMDIITSKFNDNNVKEIDKENTMYSIQTSNYDIPSSQILNKKVPKERKNIGQEVNIEINKNRVDTQIDISKQMLIEFEETQTDVTDRPTSPIFPNNVLKQPSNASPLIFNLDKFEHFESIANPIIETLDFETAKHVINSQILNKELHIKIDEINLHKRDGLITTNDFAHTESPYKNTKPIERDKTNFEDIVNQGGYTINKKSTTRNEFSTDIIRDENLFSSDEEECTATHERDLPFTCALETCFYDQADVLDKTVYVGFQTASNRSIQVLADSFAKAKSLLNDVICDDVTVTDLVNNTKRNTNIENPKMDMIEETVSDLLINEGKNSNDKYNIKDVVTETHLLTSNKEMNRDAKFSVVETDKFIGFKTANNKNIILSKNSLVRYKKVFQDIDLSEDFKSIETPILNHVDVNYIKEKNESYSANNMLENFNTTSDVLQGIDDKILQEFENINMSLEDNNKENVKTVSKMYNTHKYENTDKNLSKNRELYRTIDTTTVNQIVKEKNNKMNIGNIKLDGFKTASNKNINISKNASAKCISVIENIDDIEISDTTCKHKPETLKPYTTARGAVDKSLPSTSTDFVGFRTASNKAVMISEKAMLSTKNVFNDIDSTILPNQTIKDYPKTTSVKRNKNVNNMIRPKSCIDNQFIMSKAVNKEHTETSTTEETSIFNTYLDYNSLTKDPQQIANGHEIVYEAINQASVVNELTMDSIKVTYNEIAANEPITREFNGFKTASDKIIMISHKTLDKTKNIFKDIDLMDFESLKGNEKEYPDLDTNETSNEMCNNVKRDKILNITDPKCQNSKIPNNKYNKKIKSIDNNLENEILDQNPSHYELDNWNDKWKTRSTSPVFKGTQPEKKNPEIILDKKVIKGFDKKHTISEFSGFLTASNKQVSKTALSSSRKVLNTIDNISFSKKGEELKTLNSKQSYQKHKTDVSKDTLSKKTDNLATDVNKVIYNSNIGEPSISRNNFIGFKTANNKIIKVSDETLSKTKNIFKNIELIDSKLSNNKKEYPDTYVKASISYNETDGTMDDAKGKLRDHKMTSNEKATNSSDILNKRDVSQSTKHSVFDCENKISDTNEIVNSNNNLENRSTSPVFRNFLTENYKAVTISDEALKSIELFKTLDKEISSNMPVTGFVKFQTASNKKIVISEKALESSEKIFKDIDDINSDCNNFKSKPLYPKEIYQNDDIDNIELLSDRNISQNTKHHNLDCQNKILDNNEVINKNDNLGNRSTSPVFGGFQTGNKKPVMNSDKALKKSKELLKNLDKEISLNTPFTGFVGFQTASNKKVTISEKALQNSKKIFEDIDNINTDCNNSKSLYPTEIYQSNDIEIVFDKNTVIKPIFKGFNTASSKPISISKTALEKSKKLFQDIENNEKTDYSRSQTGNINLEVSKGTVAANKKEIKLDILKNNSFKGFQTGKNKAITVTEETLAKSKRLFSEIDGQINETLNKKGKNEISNIEDVNTLIDTQIINNFDQSLNTEDFRDSPERSKRSGSPILSCPRVKKRKKFETPYNHNTIKPIIKSKPIIKQPKIIYRDDYKKDKKYNLKDIKDITKDVDTKIDSYILQFNYDNLLDFQFDKERNELSDEIVTINLLKDDFIDSVNSKLLPDGWVDNHLKLILWKLISYEIKFKIMYCTVKNVMEQLKYRYDRELYNAERPAIRKILEKDDVPGKALVLCVVEIYSDGVTTSSVTETSTFELLLTDGWYCIRCTLDKMLIELVRSQKIVIGTKLATCGAELLGCDQGVSPWEDTSAVRLKIFGNSTRRARWDAKLGYHGNGAILSQLSSVKVLGGKVSKLRVFVTRVYPALYVEKFDDGSTVTRSERLENLHQMKMESDRQIIVEKICEEVEKEFINQDSEDSEGMSDTCKRTCMESGSQIAKMMKRSKDPVEFTALLSHTQTRLLVDHTSKNRDRLIQEMQVRVKEKIDKAGVCVNRNVVCLLKIRVAGLRLIGDKVEITKGMMSIWKPTDSVRDIIKEGASIDVMNVVPTALRLGEIQISAGRQSIFSTSKFKPIERYKPYINLLQRKCYTIKDLAQNPAISTDYNEIDTIGLIFLIDPDIDVFDPAKQSFQNIYLSDADCNIICVHFWGGLKKFGFQNIFDTGQIVFCGNLQKRAGNNRKNIPQFRVTELSYFTQTPKNEDAAQILEELNKKMLTLNKKEYCEKCIALKNNYSVFKQNNENVSPCRGIKLNNSDINLSKNKIFIDSPLVRAQHENFNFSGIDFESTFKQDTHTTSVEVLKRKRKVNEKIAKLEMYGEPPPLTNLNIINTSKKASSSYKSPLISNNIEKSITPNIHNTPKSIENSNSSLKNDSDVCENVANVKKSSGNCGNDRSIAMNRTYVKCLNPVKINFDVPNDNNDPFAEEFDVSPPLSLDDYSL